MASYCTNTENVLQIINQKYISLNTVEVALNNSLLRSTLESMISLMKSQDATFAALFEKPFFGGSYYDDLKVGKPDEFDLDLLFYNLQKKFSCETHNRKYCGCVRLEQSNKPGFFWLKVAPNFYTPLNKFLKDGYLQTDKVLNWMKGLVSRALNKMMETDSYLHFQFGTPQYKGESGPAITLRLYGKFGPMDVDLVPSFTFGPEDWPSRPYRANPSTSKKDFFMVPKRAPDLPHGERYWRASFQEQERELISGKQRLKPALRLLKKMRNNLVHLSVSSYALKTIVLWDLENGSINWNFSLSATFLKLLERYRESLDKKEILYYWNKSNNLLRGVNSFTLTNHYNEITRILRAFKNPDTDPIYIAKIILKEGTEEYRLFMDEYGGKASVQSVIRSLEGLGWSSEEREEGEQATATASSGWATAAAVVGVGAVLAAGITLFSSWRQNQNRNN